ncbi:MAG: hypothetical protein IPJ38_10870 [Dechloromonas sp.]|uniref:Uncharacterized protein n=1 Tax=Candidatus Dechloromonas phosphorivorans TaxID=2899244 RepID=A0A935K4K1_9RHOO|nr:hypothetical protein [Candidatus Dechloromonas phosphorivorans]
MSHIAPLPADQLAVIAPQDIQRLAARMAQDAFAGIFRLTLNGSAKEMEAALAEVEPRCFNWCQAGSSNEAKALRMALLISGIDQWGLAYSQTFGLNAIPGVSSLLGQLRGRLDPQQDALFQQFYDQMSSVETDAVDFKVEVRRSIHLALWHAMVACEKEAEAQQVLKCLGGMMLVLDEKMPQLGWRLLADALASIQISLLSETIAASAIAQETTQQLFEALRQALPKERFQSILAYSGQAVLAWQQSRRPAN